MDEKRAESIGAGLVADQDTSVIVNDFVASSKKKMPAVRAAVPSFSGAN